MSRVLLFTYQGDESLVKKIQAFLTDHEYDIVSVETAHCASFDLNERSIDSLFLIEASGQDDHLAEKVLELKNNRSFVAITAVVSEYFRQQIDGCFSRIFEAFRLHEAEDGHCRLQLKPLAIKHDAAIAGHFPA